MNIQHLESLADAVESITGVRIAERVPDWVVSRADQIELIDSSADQLRRRMLHGNIYPASKVPGALAGFFKTENLVALRELALRYLADETEEELVKYLENRHPGELWDTSERILVAVTGAPGNDGVVRRAARIAQRTKGDLLALYVHTADGSAEPPGLQAVRQVVKDVGGEWHDAPGDDPARAVVEFAAKHHTTQIVAGASRRSRWEEWSRGSVVRKILRFAAEAGIDVHVIARRDVVEPLAEGPEEDSPALQANRNPVELSKGE